MTPTDARDDLVAAKTLFDAVTSEILGWDNRFDPAETIAESIVELFATRTQQLTERAEQAEAQVERLREALRECAEARMPGNARCIARAALNAKPVGDGG
jgi:hypothetical protein